MIQIKIKSNPYEKTIRFQLFKEGKKEWVDINAEKNAGSELISEDILRGFFPFKISEIIDIIENEYRVGNEDVSIVFEGTDDEYTELLDYCETLEWVTVERSELYLRNAADVLPQIKSIFTNVKKIIDEDTYSYEDEDAEGIGNSTSKFIDATQDTVPIFVVGNYSSGKSTFINALVGKEILPSGENPVTAKVYKIRESDNDAASISFEYNGVPVAVHLANDECRVQGDDNIPILRELEEILCGKGMAIHETISRCIEHLNAIPEVSVQIEIQVPFAEGYLKESRNSFVIFDTPGSNTATYTEHQQALQDIMTSISNGLPIFVAESTELDGNDNEELCEEIKHNKQIDHRFAMIIVNKADDAQLSDSCLRKEWQEQVKALSIPRNLYSGGIYYVSSIMGLGAKNEGHFMSEYCEEVFEDNEKKYSDPDSKRYKTLYKYNIMPEQVKKHVVEASENCEDKILANSGLFAVEHEIVNFAETYSAYNKCTQSKGYINDVIDQTQERLNEIITEQEISRDNLRKAMERDKAELIQRIQEKSLSLTEAYANEYDDGMKEIRNKQTFNYSEKELKELEERVTGEKKKELHYDTRVYELQGAKAELVADAKALIGKPAMSKFKEIGGDIKDMFDKRQDVGSTRKQSSKEASYEIINHMNRDFEERTAAVDDRLDEASQQYWTSKAKTVREELVKIINDSQTLEDDKRRELSDIIISFEDLIFDNANQFSRRNFAKKFGVGKLIVEFNTLNLRKLAGEYNDRFAEAVKDIYDATKEMHCNNFERWTSRLIDKITGNIVDYSPLLTARSLEIERMQSEVDRLGEAVNLLENCSREITKLISTVQR